MSASEATDAGEDPRPSDDQQGEEPKPESSVRTYSRSVLLDLSSSPLSQEWPSFLSRHFEIAAKSRFDPEKWHQSNQSEGSQITSAEVDEARAQATNTKSDKALNKEKAAGNESKVVKRGENREKERVRREASSNSGSAEPACLVLSPQRRSFLEGCHANKANASTNNANGANNENGGNQGGNEVNGRDNARRVGSGRLGHNRRDYNTTVTSNGLSFSRRTQEDSQHRFNNDHNNNSDLRRGVNCSGDARRRWNEGGEPRRAPNQYGFGSRMNNSNNGVNRGAGASRYARNDESAEEPEWMSAVVDQDDMMELKGFDDTPEKDRKHDHKENNVKKGENKVLEKKNHGNNGENEVLNDSKLPVDGEKNVVTKAATAEDGFNVEDFLSMDHVPALSDILASTVAPKAHILESNANSSSSVAGSRFSQFFNRPQQGQDEDKDKRQQNQPSIEIPNTESNAFFAPISPAERTSLEDSENKETHTTEAQTQALLQILKGPQHHASVDPRVLTSRQENLKSAQMASPRIKTVEEVEAELKKSIMMNNSKPDTAIPTLQKQQFQSNRSNEAPPEDNSAFKRFAALLQESNDNHGGRPAFLSNMEACADGPKLASMEDMSLELRQRLKISPAARNMSMNGPVRAPITEQHQHQHQTRTMNHHYASHVEQQQQQQQHQPLPSVMGGPDLLSLIAQAPFNSDCLARPEANQLLRSLQDGKTSANALLQQFAYGKMSDFHREILLNVLKVQQRLGVIPTRAPSGQHQLVNQQQRGVLQQHYQQRQRGDGPSPQDLIANTQHVMHNALIKKKLEEQNDNYKRRLLQDQPEMHPKISPTQSDIMNQQRRGCYNNDNAPRMNHYTNTTPNNSTNNNSELLFTPTSVMKKLVSDRRDSQPELKPTQQHPQQLMEQQINHGIKINHNNTATAATALLLMQQQQQQYQQTQQQQLLLLQQQQQHSHAMSDNRNAALASFFSPELLAEASSAGGRLPVDAMTLEEIERRATATVDKNLCF